MLSSYKSKEIAPESSVRYFHLVMRKKTTFPIVQYFSPKGGKSSLQKNGRKCRAFPLLGVEGLEHTKKDTKVCDTHNMALIRQVRRECFCTDSKLHCAHTQHTHTPSAWKPGLVQSECSAQVQTPPRKACGQLTFLLTISLRMAPENGIILLLIITD